jgi:3'-phosphoadenosine 5'-phosphosulfate sulfotransferase (PAPS reductase)/FAD synthetase
VRDLSVFSRWSAQHPRDPLLVWVSGGKDSIAVLKLATEAIGPARIVPCFRFFVEGLRCVETPIRAQLAHFGVRHPLVTVPEVNTLELLRTGTFTPWQTKVGTRKVKFRDVEALAKKRTGCAWTASGEKQVDSLQRRFLLRPFEGINPKEQRLYPVWDWTHREVRSLVGLLGVPLAPSFQAADKADMSGVSLNVLPQIKERFPHDYAKIIDAFPLAEAILERDRLFGSRGRTIEVSNRVGRAHAKVRVERRSVQPTAHPEGQRASAAGEPAHGGLGGPGLGVQQADDATGERTPAP